MLADISMRDDSFHSLKHVHTPLHNNFCSLCFRNPALLCFVQNHFQAHSTPRMAFLQEGEDDEDTTPMHTTMIGAWHQERGVQQGCPSHEGGPRSIRFESPWWRPKETQVRVHLGVQEQPAPKLTPMPHTESGCSLYGWKDNFKELPMALFLGPNLLEVNGNSRNNVTYRICQGAVPLSFGLLTHVSCRAKWPKWWTPPWPPPATLGRPLGYKLCSHRLE